LALYKSLTYLLTYLLKTVAHVGTGDNEATAQETAGQGCQ